MLRRPHLAIEPTVNLAATAVKPANTTLPIIRTPRLARVLEQHRLRVDPSDLHLEHIGKLAVDAAEGTTRKAEQGHTSHDVLQCVLEAHIEAVLAVAAAGAGGAFVFLVLRDVYTAPAGSVALCEMEGAVSWLGIGKGAEREGGDGEEGGGCAAHFDRL